MAVTIVSGLSTQSCWCCWSTKTFGSKQSIEIRGGVAADTIDAPLRKHSSDKNYAEIYTPHTFVLGILSESLKTLYAVSLVLTSVGGVREAAVEDCEAAGCARMIP